MIQTVSRVFVVDDDEKVLCALTRLIRAAGHHVESFDSPEKFLACADLASFPACAVLDLQMSAMSGLDVQRHLDQRIPIIFLTGYGDIAQTVDAMKAGALDVLVKPVRESVLLEAIGRAVQRASVSFEKRREKAEIENRVNHLTRREREVMSLVVTGRLNKEVASVLGAAEKTIKIHRGRVMEKMQAKSIVELVRLADKAGFHATDE